MPPMPAPTPMLWGAAVIGFLAAMLLARFERWIASFFTHKVDLRAHYSPKGGCEDALLQEVSMARHEILVQAYSFTSDPLTNALDKARRRGVRVEVILDKSNEVETYSDLKILLDRGLETHIDAEHAIAHNKIVVIDQRTVVTGSYNFTHQAEHSNAENLLIIEGDRELARKYRDNFLHHKAHSRPATLRAVEKPRGSRKAA